MVVERMRTLGFLVEEDEVFTPAWAASRLIGGRSCALVDESLHEDLGRARLTEDSPEVVLVGDLGEGFTYARLDAAFRCLMEGAELVALQKNRYWQNEGGLSGCRAIRRCARVCERKRPSSSASRSFFRIALEDMGLKPAQLPWSATMLRPTSQARRKPGSRVYRSEPENGGLVAMWGRRISYSIVLPLCLWLWKERDED